MRIPPTSKATEPEPAAPARTGVSLDSPRGFFKRCLEQLASLPFLVNALERVQRGNVVILGYHNVVPDSEPITGEVPLHLPIARFREHLDSLEHYFEICSLQDVLRSDPVDPPRRLRVVITFDDAYNGTLRIAIPELARRGHPATIFAPSGLLDSPSFWWDAYGLTPTERDRTCLTELKGVGGDIDTWARKGGKPKRPAGPFQRPGTANELREAAEHAGIDVAVHTSSHPNLAQLTPREIVAELEGCLEQLRSMSIEPLPYVAYPYGLSSHEARDVVRRGRWVAGLAITGGGFSPDTQDLGEVPRVSVPSGASAENLLLRVLGIISG